MDAKPASQAHAVLSIRPTSVSTLFLAFLILVATGASAQSVTALWYQRTNDGVVKLYQSPDSFTLNATSSQVTVIAQSAAPGTPAGEVQLAAPTGTQFQVGAYEEARRLPFRGTAPGIELYGINSWGCNTVTGRFAILELTYDSEFNVMAFAADFEYHCEGSVDATWGEVRVNSSIPLTISKPPGSTTPGPFAFTPRRPVKPSETIVSNPTTIYGINSPAPISVTSGEYSINGGAFTASPGTVGNRDSVRVRATASAQPGGTSTATLTVGGRSASFTLTTYQVGEPLTAFYLRSLPGDYVGGGETLEWFAPSLTLTTSGWSGGLRISMRHGERWKDLGLAAVPGQPLVPGAYELAARASFAGTSPGLDFSGDGRGCNTLLGRFVVLEADYGPDNSVNRFAANFEQLCDGGSSAFGEIRINSTIPLNSLVATGDSSPDPFAFVAQSPVRAGATVRSNWITIYGANVPVPISITGGEYSLNGGPFTTAAGMANPLDDIVVRLVSSETPGATTQATFIAGGQSASLQVQTWQAGMSLSGVYFRSTSGDYIGGGATRLYLAPRNAVTTQGNYSNGIEAALNAVLGVQYRLNIAAPGNVLIAPGTYEGAMRWPFQTAGKPGLDFSGAGRACNQSAGRFVVHEVSYGGAGGGISKLAVDFEQRCEINGPPLFGEVRFNSTVPFSALQNATCEEDAAFCQADVGISYGANLAAQGTGKDVILIATATNLGPEGATNVKIDALHGAGAEVVWASPACAQIGPLAHVCDAGVLAANQSKQFKIVLRRAAPGALASEARVSSTQADPVPANDVAASSSSISASPAGQPVVRYRLYSPVTLEHHFTTDLNEYTVLGNTGGTWIQEGTVGKVLDNPGLFGGAPALPYYRLYDTSTRWHHWTTDPNEYYTLAQLPWWNAEGVDGYILPSNPPGTIELYRLTYTAIPGLHHWTTDPVEFGELISKYGWIGEPGAGFVIQ